MTCESIRRTLQEHVDGLLLPLDRAATEAHLEACAACRSEAGRLRALERALARLPDADVPDDFAARVMAELPEMLPAQHGAAHLLRWGIAAGVTLFAFLTSLALLARHGGSEVASQAIEPLSASLHLGGLLLAQAAGAAATILDAAARAFALSSWEAKLAFVVLFCAAHLGLAVALQRYPTGHHASPRAPRR